jgi:ABC transporter with metal-binding/Fe-S-binding domain ATP-binding protein
MKLGILFSGGKDSVLALALAKEMGHEISCLINIISDNKYSYMFHTPSVDSAVKQAEAMDLPIFVKKTPGEKEDELSDLKDVILEAKEKYFLEGIVTGAVQSVYQASRIKKICDDLKLELINPLWKMDELEILTILIKRNFDVRIVGIFAYPLTEKYLGRKIDEIFIEEFSKLKEKYKINPAGEGGEFETFVLDCNLFKKKLKIIGFEDFKEGENSFRRELKVEIVNGK